MSDKTPRQGNLPFLQSLPRQPRLRPSKDMFLVHNLHPHNPPHNLPTDNLNPLHNPPIDNLNLLHNPRTGNLNLLLNLPSPPHNPPTGNRNLLLSLD